MRRIIYKDPEFDVTVTLDMPEEVFEQVLASLQEEGIPISSVNVATTCRKLVEYTINRADHEAF